MAPRWCLKELYSIVDNHPILRPSHKAQHRVRKRISSSTSASNKATRPVTSRYDAHPENHPVKTEKRRWKFSPFVLIGDPDPGSNLCDRCQKIDFKAIFGLRQLNHEGIPVVDLAKNSVQRGSNCQFCQFLEQTIFDTNDRNTSSRRLRSGKAVSWHLRAFSGSALFQWRSRELHQDKIGVFLVPCRGKPTRSFDIRMLPSWSDFLIEEASHLHQEAESELFFQGNKLSQSNFDLDTIRGLIKKCVRSHGCCHTFSSSPTTIRVIDCSTMEIVELPDKSSYAALSYVWGNESLPTKHESKLIQTSKRLPPIIPQTIQDAIRVVQELDQQYLWVDRYCIDQFHSADKAIQIASMADIYETAVFTIVALGSSATSGLPGVSQVRHRQQRFFSCQGRRYVSTGRNLLSTLEESTWSTRAWMLQEAVLCRRCLFFSSSKVFFKCGLGVVCEINPNPAPLLMRTAAPWLENLCNPPCLVPMSSSEDLDDNDLRRSFEMRISEYSLRDMRYESDALNAFKGILSRSGCISWWGVPLLLRSYQHPRVSEESKSKFLDVAFILGLLWKKIYLDSDLDPPRANRRKGFPSWSWVSYGKCYGSSSFLDFIRVYDLRKMCYYADLLVIDDCNSAVEPFSEFARREQRSFIPETAQSLRIRSAVVTIPSILTDGTPVQDLSCTIGNFLLCFPKFQHHSDLLSHRKDCKGSFADEAGLLIDYAFPGIGQQDQTKPILAEGNTENFFWDDPGIGGELEMFRTGEAVMKCVLLLVCGDKAEYDREKAVAFPSCSFYWLVICQREGLGKRIGTMTTRTYFDRMVSAQLLQWEELDIA